jgi:hypothetical protein
MNVAENDHVELYYEVKGPPSRVHMQVTVFPGDPEDEETFSVPEHGVPVVSNETNWCASSEKSYRVSWDGRRPSGQLILGVLDGTAPITVTMPIPKRLSGTAILVDNEIPRLQGREFELGLRYPTVEVRANPFQITHSYDQVATMAYCVDQTAKVTVTILAPGYYDLSDPAGIVAVPVDDETVEPKDCEGTNYDTFQWAGTVGSDPTVLSNSDGYYTFLIEARHPAQASLKTIYRGVLDVRQ